VFAKIPFFGPIIPEAQSVCPASWGLVITVINNLIEFLITIAIVFVAPVMIAYAGFLYVVNPMNPSGMSNARSILKNTVIGIVVALSAWLIVAAVMAVFYNPKAVGKTWSELITSGGIDPCLKQAGSITELRQVSVPGVAGITVTTPGTTSLTPAQIRAKASAAKAFKTQVCAAASTQGIPTQCSQLLGILGVESGGIPTSVSPEGAIGLMQLIPTTAASNGVSACVGSSDISPSAACIAALKNSDTNIKAGVTNYAKLFKKFSGNQTYATAAYNAGDGTGLKPDGKKQAFAKSSDCPGMFAWECPINPGGFVETQKYVLDVAAVAQQL